MDSRQGSGDDLDLSIGNIAAAGERCIDKVVMVEETEYDDHVTCKHSYSERCHTTYTTDFEPQQEEDCEENFRKNCVTKSSPETECKPVVLELCGPELEAVSGEEECFDEKQTVVQEVPEETCNLEPQRECKHVTK